MELFLKRVKAWMLVTVMVLSLVAAPGTSAAWADSEENYDTTCKHDGEKEEIVVPARPDEDGYIRTICAVCEEPLDEKDIIAPVYMELSKYSYTYNKKTHKPSVEVYDFDEEEISPDYYTVSYSGNCKDAGTYKVKVTFHGRYEGTMTDSFDIAKAKQTLEGKNYSKTTASDDFKLSIKGAKGKLTYKSFNTKVAKVSAKGKVTITGPGYCKLTVSAASTKNYKSAKKTITIQVKPKKVTSVSVKKTGSQKLKVSWKKQSRVSKYQIRYAKNSSFKNAKTVTVSSNHSSKVLGGLSKGTKYYVQVRAVKSSNGNTYKGAWSATKSATTQKAKSSSSSNKTNTVTNTGGGTVYVTPTGSCYHTHACGRGNYYKSTLSEAKARGLRPCSKCY